MKKQLSKKLAAFIIVIMMFSGSIYAQWGVYGSHVYDKYTGNVGIGIMPPSDPPVHARLEVKAPASGSAAVAMFRSASGDSLGVLS
jgi:hypothetical protein